MNRDIIEQGRSKKKMAETFALVGGIGAIIYPLIVYYVGSTAIFDRQDFLECRVKEELEHKAKKEDFSDNVRFTMSWNCFMIVVFLIFHFVLFTRPDSMKMMENMGMAFPIMLIAEIVFALINFILIGTSICNDGSHGTSAILSSLAILIINGVILTLGILYYLAKTKVPVNQVGNVPEEKRQLTDH